MFEVDWSTLPVPKAEEDITHLENFVIQAHLSLNSTHQEVIHLNQLKGVSVIFIYPRSGQPGKPLPSGWNEIPGARGCTPQTCAFRDNFQGLKQAGANQIYGLSSQQTEYQKQFASRLKLPFQILSDQKMLLAAELNLPTFKVEEMTLYKRITLVLLGNKIIKYFYPVFPPDKNAYQVQQYLKILKN